MSPTQYQWGKLSRGQPYVIFATDMLFAIMSIGLNKHEGKLLAYILKNTWGKTAKRGRKGSPWPDTTPCDLDDLKALSEALKMPKNRICEAKTSLLNSRVIVRVEGGCLVNKEAHEWVNPKGESLLSGGALDVAKAEQKAIASVAQDDAIPGSRNDFDASIPGSRNESTITVPGSRNAEAPVIPGSRNDLGGSVPGSRNAQNEESHAGKPYGVNTNPTGSLSNAREIREAVPKQRGLALSEGDEPFISPPDAPPLPIPAASDDPETTSLLARLTPLVLKATSSADYPDGNGDVVEAIARQARIWRRQNYPGDVIEGFVKAAFDAGVRSSLALSRYVVKCLIRYADELRNFPSVAPGTRSQPANSAQAKRDKIRADIAAERERRRKESDHVHGA